MPEYSNIESKIDQLLRDKPEALKRVKDNRRFKKRIREEKIAKSHEDVQVFGMKNVNINAILKDNLWDRSIFTTDKLCRMFLGCTLEQLKKYERKKRAVPMNMLWIILIMFGVVAVILVVLFLLPRLGAVL